MHWVVKANMDWMGDSQTQEMDVPMLYEKKWLYSA